MVNMWLLIVFATVICGALGQSDTQPKVNINQGTVVGSVVGANFEFYGIPFADSTAGANRFKAPSAPPTFEDEFIANRNNVKCVRALGVGYEGTEDCLVVNVLTPTLNNSSRLPVMVWLKGKELDNTNDLDLSFQRFLEKEVVIVHVNYRESILGFLCLGTESAPGNAGLKDIIAGLRWIQENIVAFGGDPNNVSLFGHGSGAAAVDLITLTPLAEGLVHKAIAQSGTALAPWAVTRNNLKYAIDVAEALGHTVNDIETLSDIYARSSVAALMAVINELDLTDNSLAFAPCVEKEIENVEAALLKSPYQTIMEGNQLQIPFMTGFVDNEGTIRANKALNSDWIQRMEESFVDFIQPDIIFYTEEQELLLAQEIKSHYFGNQTINDASIDSFLSYHGETMILISAIREARMRAASSNATVYLYQFSYRGGLSDSFERPLPIEGAGHSEELLYLFRNENDINTSTFDLAVSDILLERWTNFAKTGTPTSETSQVTWEPYTFTRSHYLRILDDEEINVNGNSNFDIELENPHSAALTFWDSIYAQHFNDAESIWSLEERLEEDDEETEVNDSDEEDDDENGEEDEDSQEGDDDDDGSPDSASTAVGYTFTIVTLFTILNQYHAHQILS